MKYRVVGWTDYENDEVEASAGCIGFAERNAIIDDIRRNGYCFSGYDHQEMWNCAPVLNDGKKRLYSQRGWGGVMAEAYGHTGSYSYARFAFQLRSRDSHYPSQEFDHTHFLPEHDLSEHFDIEVATDIFELSQKRTPFFLEDLDELRFIDSGDTLTLHCGPHSATFFIYDINRNRNIQRKNTSYTINTKYKILVTARSLASEE